MPRIKRQRKASLDNLQMANSRRKLIFPPVSDSTQNNPHPPVNDTSDKDDEIYEALSHLKRINSGQSKNRRNLN